jgi:hypothetical protein
MQLADAGGTAVADTATLAWLLVWLLIVPAQGRTA